MSNTRGSSKEAIDTTREADLAAFDALSPAVRAFLRESPLNLTAEGARATVRRCGGAEAFLAMNAKVMPAWLAQQAAMAWGPEHPQASPDAW